MAFFLSHLFFHKSYGVLRVSLLCLFDLCDSIRAHFPQRVFSLVGELFGQLGEVLSVLPRYSAGEEEETVRFCTRNKKR